MLGYPSTCSRGAALHSCTLSLACWLVGGSSQPGCGANPWLVACCVTPHLRNKHSQHQLQYVQEIISKQERFDKVAGLEEIEAKENPPSANVLQRRADEVYEEEECGVSADRSKYGRIIGGKEARFAQFPWQAHIRISQYQCGGVLGIE